MFGGDFYGIVVLLCPVEGYGYGLFRLVINGRDLNGIRGIVLEAEILASVNNCCIQSVIHIVNTRCMVMAFYDGKIRLQARHKQGGGHLADSAADILGVLAAYDYRRFL